MKYVLSKIDSMRQSHNIFMRFFNKHILTTMIIFRTYKHRIVYRFNKKGAASLTLGGPNNDVMFVVWRKQLYSSFNVSEFIEDTEPRGSMYVIKGFKKLRARQAPRIRLRSRK